MNHIYIITNFEQQSKGPVAAICQKSWGPGLRPPLSLRQSSFLPFPLMDSKGVWAEPAHPLPNTLMKFMQSNSVIKSTLMFNVLQKSACMQSSATVGRTDTMDYRPCIAAWQKVGGSCTFGPPLLVSRGQDSRTPTGSPLL